MSLPRGRSLLSAACGGLALLAGGLIALGWLTHTAVLLRAVTGVTAAVLGSAVCLLLGGCSLVLAAKGRSHQAPWLGLPMMVVAATALYQTAAGHDLGADLPSFHAWMQDFNPHPGRMASNTGLGYLLLGLGLCSQAIFPTGRWGWRLRGLCATGALLLSLTGLLAHVVHPELLFGWHGDIVRMAPYSGFGILLLTLGCAARWWPPAARRADTPQAHRRRIFNTAAIALTVVALITGTAGFAWQLSSVTQSAQDHLSRTLEDRELVLREALGAVHQKVEAMAASPVLIAAVSKAAQPELRTIASSLLANGFSHVAIDGPEGELISAGASVGKPALDVPLKNTAGSLAWQNGYFVRYRQPIVGPRGAVGYLRAEQVLKVQSLLAAEMQHWGQSFEMALCAEADAAHIVCFPQRLKAQWFVAPKVIDGQPLPMVLALEGGTGVTSRLDFRRHQVMAAYAPVGHTGLGMVLKVDADELYAPARRQFLIVLPLLALIVLAGLWALRLRLRPLVRELIATREAAQANEARFIAAMESGLDAFYILRAERDAKGAIVDFRFTYVTGRGAALVSLTPPEVEGRLLCELLPINRTGGFFDKYKAVVETGIPLAEEFSIDQPGVVATWISHQIVKLGDDSIAITSRDISASKHAQEAVRQSEELLRLITDSVPALIAYLSAEDERYIFINRGGAELYGKPVEEIVGRTVIEVVGPDNYRLMKAHILTVQAGQQVTYERQVMRADGTRHVVTSYFPHRDEHGRLFVCALSHDITARKQIEAALAASQDRLKAVTDNVPALISYIDRDHCFRFANQAYREWLGVDPEAMMGRNLRELYGEVAYARIRPHLVRALAGETVHYERELPGPDTVRHVHVTMTPHRDAQGEVSGLYVLMNDITAVKKAEEQSARSEERLSLALEGSHLALFDWDLSTNQVFNSAHWSSMIGGPPVETITDLGNLRQLVHPEDLPGVLAKVASTLKGQTTFYNAEHRVRTGSGDWLWICTRGRVVERDANGRALRLSGTNADIADQKRLEAQLQRMAEIDALTGLPNRGLFNDRLDRALARLRRQGGVMALMLLDIDFFKAINDGLGHDAGDAVLQEFARRLMATVRLTDTVARLGGDEFTIILEGLHSASEAELVASKVVASMLEDFTYAGQALRVTTSVGLACVEAAVEPLALIKLADQALYRAKAAGRNTYCT